ncbi:MAG: YigZ family protein [Alkalibacterium sp.]|nr:YigZ family protein [Alkalibacterium sp.]
MKNHRTIKDNGSIEFVIKKSRFICSMKRTDTEEDAQQFIDSLKKEHMKANHNCSAYLIGENSRIQRASDDGEPSGTAGVPILEVLKKNELENVTAVVTRYFGGVKLGAGGLIRAYGKAASEAIKEIGIVEKRLHQFITVDVSYHMSGKLQNALHQSPYRLESVDYTDCVTFTCVIDLQAINTFCEEVIEWTSDQATISHGKQAWIEVTVD